MKFKLIILCFLLWNPLSSGAQKTQVLTLDSNRQLFVDDYMVSKMDGVQIMMHHPADKGIAFKFDKPWEGNFCAYFTIIKDGTLFRAYYRGLRYDKDNSDSEVTCYAESDDGINWRKPNLKLYQVNGTRNNNVVLAEAAPVMSNFSPFIDTNPNANPDEKYKALGGSEKSGLIAYISSDGIHWKRLQEKAVFSKGLFDSQNVSFWSTSEKKYICYFRTWSGKGYTGNRSVSRTTSDDFLHWSEPIHMTFGDTPPEDLYTQQTSPYFRAPQIYIAIGARFIPGRQVISEAEAKALNVIPGYYKDCSDAILMTTRGGDRYNRTFMESFIRPGIGLGNWISRTNYPALNVVQTSAAEMSIYLNENYAQPTAYLRRYALRLDGFASLHAGYQGGEMVTKPFTFAGKELEINYATSAAGDIEIELQDENGNPIPGFAMDDTKEIIGNEIKRVVYWKANTNLCELSSRIIRLRIHLKDADLYSFRFK
jgi:hypothetical protein